MAWIIDRTYGEPADSDFNRNGVGQNVDALKNPSVAAYRFRLAYDEPEGEPGRVAFAGRIADCGDQDYAYGSAEQCWEYGIADVGAIHFEMRRKDAIAFELWSARLDTPDADPDEWLSLFS